ncbi:indolepyruvate ferredoxin oxidoreductase subunit beta [Thermogladius calderae 1633]|uniref:Indolepyruvate ferredoxin oxidoreductase subunit beta n=1 Tax=Thermogladius calderae (strain DSM 22663 / VKM B-2946 / 1633) TaxID=1184251 RepID=I3TEA0_THEC1|nr:2-oxoacid:acceptor oxidoreductase family protein [Thermogladius calderae]AFK51088.1 indolepyruvate ferredoxin oxidoreductase subunit beta [Thermogladius calderae 1633]
MSEKLNVLIVGVGGQGVLTLGSLIAWASTLSGIEVTVAETHGLSQRGGSLAVHVRLNNKDAPIIPVGEADHVIALEALEALRYLSYARRGAVLVVNRLRLPPPLTRPPGLDVVEEALRKTFGGSVYVYDADNEAKQVAGSPLYSNTLLLGISIAVDERLRRLISTVKVEEAIDTLFSGRAAEANLRAFNQGLKIGFSLATTRGASKAVR